MRVIIAGSSSITSYDEVFAAIRASGFMYEITTVISGGAIGVDSVGEEWAREQGIPVERFPAEWSKYGKMAGFKRNTDMAMVADALIAVWNGKSSGTKHMIGMANEMDMEVFIWRVKK